MNGYGVGGVRESRIQIPESRPLAVRTGAESVSLSDTSHFGRQVSLARTEMCSVHAVALTPKRGCSRLILWHRLCSRQQTATISNTTRNVASSSSSTRMSGHEGGSASAVGCRCPAPEVTDGAGSHGWTINIDGAPSWRGRTGLGL